MGKMAGRPMLQDLVKSAIANSAGRARITEEARLQAMKLAEEKCSGCGEPMDECSCKSHSKKASASTENTPDQVEKLASVLDFLAEELSKEAEGHRLGGPYELTEKTQGNPPGVLEATSSKSLPDHKGQGVHTVPMNPGTQKGLPKEHGATMMENTLNEAPQLHKEQIQTNYGKKTASVIDLVRQKLAASKAAADEHEKKETEGLSEVKKGLEKAEKAHESEPENKKASIANLVDYMATRVKQAEDAINPAQISAGAAVPPETSEAGESQAPPVGGSPQGPTGLVGSSDSARSYTKGQAYKNRKEDLRQYFAEPALSSAHDSTLQVAFDHTSEAGPKIASASVKTAAAKVILSRLVESMEDRKDATNTTSV
ncbi:MAG TPA: hypothetical protein VFS41_05730 [Edaphobacter sp.]|nr:hypothetical protein [Edaphobacter sp.]